MPFRWTTFVKGVVSQGLGQDVSGPRRVRVPPGDQSPYPTLCTRRLGQVRLESDRVSLESTSGLDTHSGRFCLNLLDFGDLRVLCLTKTMFGV